MAAAAACCCLIQSSQRCSEACRIRAVWYLLRLSAFRLGDRSWMVRWSSPSSIGPSMAGRRSVRWRAERCTARREKHGSDAMSGSSGICLCPLAASTSALVSARRCSWCRCMAAALAPAPLNDIVRKQRSASSFRPAGPPLHREFSQSCAQMRPPFFVVPPPRNPPTLIGSGSTSLSSYLLQTQNVRSASPWAGPSLHATEGAVEVRRARRRLRDTVTDERVAVFTPD